MKTLINCGWCCLLAVSMMTSYASADIVFSEDFSGVADGPLAQTSGGPVGWEGQGSWTVSGGMATSSGAWQRARFIGADFGADVGDYIKISTSMTLLGSENGGGDFATIGFADTSEHTGANTPQVAAGLNWNSATSTLSIGGATDTNYTAGDVLDVMLTFTRGAAAGQWTLDTMLTNTATGASISASGSAADSVGSESGITAWDSLDAGGTANFGTRLLDNGNSATLAFSTITVETPTTAIPEPASAMFASVLLVGLVTRRRR